MSKKDSQAKTTIFSKKISHKPLLVNTLQSTRYWTLLIISHTLRQKHQKAASKNNPSHLSLLNSSLSFSHSEPLFKKLLTPPLSRVVAHRNQRGACSHVLNMA